MNKKIAIPMAGDLLCSHFGHCQQFAIVETRDKEIIKYEKVVPPPHQPGVYPHWIAQFGVTDVIVGGIGQQAIALFNAENINVHIGAPVAKMEELVKLFLENKLPLYDNSCNHDLQPGGGHQHHNRRITF